jgi:hypothetical protein
MVLGCLMARSRFLRPEFFTDDKMADLPYEACWLFQGIWVHADLRGVFEWSPRLLRSQIFGMREASIEQVKSWLEKLESVGVVSRLAQGQPRDSTKEYGYVPSWYSHQHISTREVEIGSDRPIPPGWTDPPKWARIVENYKKSFPGRGCASPGTAQGQHSDNSPTPSPAPATTPEAGERTNVSRKPPARAECALPPKGGSASARQDAQRQRLEAEKYKGTGKYI